MRCPVTQLLKGTNSNIMRPSLLFVLALLLPGICACTLQYPIIGIADNYNEVLRGTVTSNLLNGQGRLEGMSVVSGVKCSGTAAVTQVPDTWRVAGQRGVGALTCEDGRQIQASYTVTGIPMTGIPTGSGVGRDQYGNGYTFSFGMSDDEAEEKVREYVRAASARPALPNAKTENY